MKAFIDFDTTALLMWMANENFSLDFFGAQASLKVYTLKICEMH